MGFCHQSIYFLLHIHKNYLQERSKDQDYQMGHVKRSFGNWLFSGYLIMVKATYYTYLTKSRKKKESLVDIAYNVYLPSVTMSANQLPNPSKQRPRNGV